MKTLIIYIATAILAVCGAECSAQTVSGNKGGYDYVDLGLPSGTLWATSNVGATSPTMYGDYFAWGETKPKGEYNWTTYKWGTANSNGDLEMLTKYRKSGNKSQIVLDASDDAATANWGNDWRMPTTNEVNELHRNCKWAWTKSFKGSGVAGYVGTSTSNGNVIFLPAAGNIFNTNSNYEGYYGYYWSASLDEYNSAFAYGYNIYNSALDRHNYFRYNGHTVRAVVKKTPPPL